MSLSIRGADAIGGTLDMPLRGNWTYDGDIDATSVPLGHAVIAYTGKRTVSFAGTVIEASTQAARTRVRIVGGAGGLRQEIPARGYGETPASTVAKDIAVACGEALADGVVTALQSTLLPGFHRTLGSGARALDALCDALGAGWNWRVLAAGTVWVGQETWTSFTPAPFLEKEPDENGVATYAGDQPDLTPGVNVDGRRVSSVRHLFDGSLRTAATLLPASANGSATAGTVDRERQAQAAFVKSKLPDYDRLPHYEARVIEQRSDGKVDLKCDDARVGDVPGVPLFFGIPGVTVTLGAGTDARVLVGFNGASSTSRHAVGFSQDCEAESITIRVATLIIEADEILLGGAGGRVLRDGDRCILPVGAAGTPTPMPLTLDPSVTEVGAPGVGFSVVKA